jgi:tetratricopeptide (TPR) repeat protein
LVLVLLVCVIALTSCSVTSPAEEAFRKGMDFSQAGRFYEAITQFTKAIQIKPSSIAYSFRSYDYLMLNNPALAIVDCDKAIEIDPKNTQAYNNRAAAYKMQGNFDQAIADCNKAIELNPNIAYPYKNRALVYCSKKEYAKAWIDVHKAESMGYKFDPEFIQKLKKASARQG